MEKDKFSPHIQTLHRCTHKWLKSNFSQQKQQQSVDSNSHSDIESITYSSIYHVYVSEVLSAHFTPCVSPQTRVTVQGWNLFGNKCTVSSLG